jgi:predicted GNAT family acetyltransferase
MTVIQHDGQPSGYFSAIDDQGEAGRMTYSWAGRKMIIIDHTEVDPARREKGTGSELVMAGVNFAREKGLKIVPRCAFAKRLFEKKKEIRDVLFE